MRWIPHSFALASGAKRFEVGSVFRPGIAALDASLAWLMDEVGMDFIFARHRELAALRAKSYRQSQACKSSRQTFMAAWLIFTHLPIL